MGRDPLCSGQLWRLDRRGVAQPIRSVAPMVFEAIKVRSIFGLRSPPATNDAPRGGGLQGVGDMYNRCTGIRQESARVTRATVGRRSPESASGVRATPKYVRTVTLRG